MGPRRSSVTVVLWHWVLNLPSVGQWYVFPPLSRWASYAACELPGLITCGIWTRTPGDTYGEGRKSKSAMWSVIHDKCSFLGTAAPPHSIPSRANSTPNCMTCNHKVFFFFFFFVSILAYTFQYGEALLYCGASGLHTCINGIQARGDINESIYLLSKENRTWRHGARTRDLQHRPEQTKEQHTEIPTRPKGHTLSLMYCSARNNHLAFSSAAYMAFANAGNARHRKQYTETPLRQKKLCSREEPVKVTE